MALLDSRTVTIILAISLVPISEVHGQVGVTVTLSLQGNNLSNDSFVNADDIGENDDALLCHTDNTDCCTNRVGEWYFPGGDRVEIRGEPPRENVFYRNRGLSVVRLNRHGNSTARGRFSCQVPDNNDVVQTIFVNIVDIDNVTISLHGPTTAIAGSIISLECSVDIFLKYPIEQVNLEWFFGPDNSSLQRDVAVYAATNHSNVYTSTLQFSPLLLSHAGMYTCQLGGNERLVAKTMIVVNLPSLRLDVKPMRKDVTSGNPVTFTVSPTFSVTTFQWQMNGVYISGEQSNILTISNVAEINEGNYTCIVTTNFGVNIKSTTAQLFVFSPAEITTHPSDKTSLQGNSTMFSVEAAGDELTYQWQRNNMSLQQNNDTKFEGVYIMTLTVNDVQVEDAGTYRCVVTNGAGDSVTSNEASLKVGVISSVVISPSNPTGSVGDTFNLKCLADIVSPYDFSAPIFEWFFGPNNSSLPYGVIVYTTMTNNKVYTSTLVFTPLQLFHSGIYTCQVNAGAHNLGTSVLLQVYSNPTVSISDSGSLTGGENYTLICSVFGLDPSNTVISYQWTKNNSTTQTSVGNSSTLSFFPLKLSDAGQYICEATVNSQMYGAIEYINIQIPTPTFKNFTSDPVNPIRPIGSNVTLTCAIELSPAVDVPVTTHIHLIDHIGVVSTNLTQAGNLYTSTAVVMSFGRNQSGVYSCVTNISSSFPYLIDSKSQTFYIKVTVGVYLSLKGNVYANNSVIFITEIGISLNGLQCITDKLHCCRFYPNITGEWFFPNGLVVPTKPPFPTSFYQSKGYDDGTVSLNRVNSDVVSPTGSFCCAIPDINDENQILCAKIDKLTVNITSSGINTAGETFALECSVNGYLANFEWTKQYGNLVTSESSIRTVTDSLFSSRLEFVPLYRTHTGTYTCSVNVNGTTETKSTALFVRVPNVTVLISDRGLHPQVGNRYSLVCSVTGAESLNATIAYQWMRQYFSLIGYSNILHFPSLRLSDAGRYICQISASSSYLSQYITATNSYDVKIIIPVPLSVAIKSNQINPIRPLGTDVTLTCIVELSPAVDVPVTVNTVWTGPDGVLLSDTAPMTLNSTFYVSTALVNSFGREQSGVYTCRSKVVSSRPQYAVNSTTLLTSTRITVGVYLLLNETVYANNSIISIAKIGKRNYSSASNQSNYGLQCITDKRKCCLTGFGSGEWNFPNGSLVPEQGNNTSFYVSRDSGRVTLNHVYSNDIMSVSGLFCCEIPSAQDITQKLCSIIIPNLVVNIQSSGNMSTGSHNFNLRCSLSGAENLDATISFHWNKNNGMYTQLGSNLNYLTLRISDEGQYTCHATVSSRRLHHSIKSTSSPFTIQLSVPQPVVRLVSNTPNSILSGSSPTLTCTVELNPAVDVPVDITTVWSGPDGSTLTADASPVMKSLTHYTSKLTLNYVELADSGNYTCTVSIGGKIRASVSKEIFLVDGTFQLRLINTDVCHTCCKCDKTNKDVELYKHSIEEALIESIESRCECHFPNNHLFNATFICASSSNLATYRNSLIGTHNFNATQLIGFIQDWVTSRPYINIKGYAVWLDRSCPVAIASLNDPECGEVSQCPCANDPNVAKCVEHIGNEDFTACINSCI